MFHVSPISGKPEVCNAVKVGCPYSQALHSESKEGTTQIAEDLNEGLYGEDRARTLKGELANELSRTSILLNSTASENTGWDAECFMAAEYGRLNGLDEIYTFQGDTVSLKVGKRSPKQLRDKVDSIIREHYAALGKPISTKDIVRTLQVSPDGDHIFVQMGSPEVTDFAILKGDQIAVIGESKKVQTGAQFGQIYADAVSVDGVISTDNFDILTDEQKERVKSLRVKDFMGQNPTVSESSEEALATFAKQYQKKGVELLLFVKKDGSLGEVDISGTPEEASERMTAAGLTGAIKIRKNKTLKVLSDTDYERLAKNEYGALKEGVDLENLKVSDLDPSLVSWRDSSPAIGDFTVGKKKRWGSLEEFLADKDAELPSKDFRTFAAILTGELKHQG